MATADLTVIGLGRSDPSAGEYIAEIQRRLAAQDRSATACTRWAPRSRARPRTSSPSSASCTACPSSWGCRASTRVLKLDERRDKEQTLDDKVRSVEERLAED